MSISFSKILSKILIGDIKMNRIKDLREDLDLKQSELAEKIGITQKAISNYETGKSEPSFDILFKQITQSRRNSTLR